MTIVVFIIIIEVVNKKTIAFIKAHANKIAIVYIPKSSNNYFYIGTVHCYKSIQTTETQIICKVSHRI